MKNILILGLIFTLSVFSCDNKKSSDQKQETEKISTSQLNKENLTKEKRVEIHNSLSKFLKPISLVKTKKFLIRIDELKDHNYRYASWSLGSSMFEKPDLIINNGKLIREGTGGNHRYEFTNKNYKYIIEVNQLAESGTPDAYLKVLNSKKEILIEDGTFVNENGLFTNTTKQGKGLPDPSVKHYEEVLGDYLMENETIGGLKLGLSIKELTKLLGEPESKEKTYFSDATGEYLGKILYPSKGISIGTIGKDETDQYIGYIDITKPCKLKTSDNIGVNSSVQEILKAYQPHLDSNKYKGKTEIILGTIYGGMFLRLKDDKVTNIFLGPGAE